MMLLTAKSVSALTMPEGKTDHIEWDAELKGFGYRLRAERRQGAAHVGRAVPAHRRNATHQARRRRRAQRRESTHRRRRRCWPRSRSGKTRRRIAPSAAARINSACARSLTNILPPKQATLRPRSLLRVQALLGRAALSQAAAQHAD